MLPYMEQEDGIVAPKRCESKGMPPNMLLLSLWPSNGMVVTTPWYVTFPFAGGLASTFDSSIV